MAMTLSAAMLDKLWALLTPQFALFNDAGERVSEWVTADRGAVVRIRYEGPPTCVAIGVNCGEPGPWEPITWWHFMSAGDQLEERVDLTS